MLQTIRQNKRYFILLGLYLSLASLILLNINKGEDVLFLNKNHNPLLDFVFKYITLLGDGLFIVPFILVILLFKSRFEGIVIATSVIVTFLLIQFLKNVPFSGSPRPSKFFSPDINLYYVQDLTIHGYNSFPSGHTGQAFALFLLLSFFSKNKNWTFLYFILALLTATSRIYLAQHFLIDTFVGAIIASIISFFVYIYFTQSSLASKKNLQKGLFF